MAPQKVKQSHQQKNIYINEPLPEIEASIANEAKKRDMIVSTHNCVVSVLVENGINKPRKNYRKTTTKNRSGDQRKKKRLRARKDNLSITITEIQNNENQA